jgi:hypothetical protein
MQLGWTGANVVLVAQNHNPSIFSPDWVQRHHIIDEPQEDFVHTPVFSLYKSSTFQMVADPDRFQLILRVLSPSNLQALEGAITRLIQTLPHVPYKAVGLNFTWIATPEAPGEGAQRMDQLFLSDPIRLRSAFPEGSDVKLGGIVYNVSRRYRLRLLVEPKIKTEENVRLDFNYHFDARSSDEALNAVSSLLDCFSSAEQSCRILLGGA